MNLGHISRTRHNTYYVHIYEVLSLSTMSAVKDLLDVSRCHYCFAYVVSALRVIFTLPQSLNICLDILQ